ncbi:MAG: hypothetical protein WB629_07395, partial [Candidatus Sulfotelmatobacter sp.]
PRLVSALIQISRVTLRDCWVRRICYPVFLSASVERGFEDRNRGETVTTFTKKDFELAGD